MPADFTPTDATLVDTLRKAGACSIVELARTLGVTATAVRQRLNRLRADGLVSRELQRTGRGRPGHAYTLTAKGRRAAGADFSDLALVLWEELRAIPDVQVRRGLLQRLATRLAEHLGGQITGADLASRMASLAQWYADRKVPFEVDTSGDLPVIHALACPYPGLAERDRGVCSMERLLFTELLGQDVRLSGCRLDGETCCTFQPSGV